MNTTATPSHLNRAQRRKLQQHPEVEALAASLAEEFTELTLAALTPMLAAREAGQPVDLTTVMDERLTALFHQKGEELGQRLLQQLKPPHTPVVHIRAGR